MQKQKKLLFPLLQVAHCIQALHIVVHAVHCADLQCCRTMGLPVRLIDRILHDASTFLKKEIGQRPHFGHKKESLPPAQYPSACEGVPCMPHWREEGNTIAQ
jgi:hypothetical protein